MQFVITTTADYQQLAQVLAEVQAEAAKSGLFIFTDTRPEVRDTRRSS